jgi:hypothetical protein
MAHTKIMARGTSGDDFMHLKTSHIKSRVKLLETTVHFEAIHEKNVKIFLNEVLQNYVENFAPFLNRRRR